jgi:hypothetical protein
MLLGVQDERERESIGTNFKFVAFVIYSLSAYTEVGKGWMGTR